MSDQSMNNEKLAVILVSGGMDSLVTAAIAHQNRYNLAFLHLNYRQRTQEKELECFRKIAEFYQVPTHLQKIVDVDFFAQIGNSSLTDENIPIDQYQPGQEEIPSSYVPFRNTLILAMAVSWAETIKASAIFIGAVHEDSSGYPDCRPEYYQAYNQLIKVGTAEGNIKIETPIIHLDKKQIVEKAIELKAPVESSWSCYARNDIACGTCDSCALRLRGFEKAGEADPIEYLVRPTYLE